MKNKAKRFLINSGLVLHAFGAGFIGGITLSEVDLRKEFYDGISIKTKEVTKIQEDALKIRYEGEPDIYFNPVFKVFGMPGNFGGSYSQFFDATWIDVTNEHIKKVAAHEEGHRYIRILKGKLGLRNNLIKNIFSGRSDGERIVDEGIANYFEAVYRIKAENDVEKYGLLEEGGFYYYKKIDGCPVCYYTSGSNLVKPILDLGVDNGIEALAKNPMKKEDLEDLIGYQQRILRIVKKQ